MKRFLTHLVVLLIIITGNSAFAQINSVLLKDGAGNVLSQHISIAAAYNAIPATITQAYIIEITATYDGSNEGYPIVFFAKTGASSANTITLRPEAGVTSVAITSTQAGLALLQLNDADWIIVDGRPGGVGTTKALTFDNQGTSSTSYSIQLIDGATNNVFQWFNVKGFFAASTGGKGIYIDDSINPSGNSDNTFQFLTFDEGPRYHINSSGTAANKNNNLVVYGCEFKNIKFCGWWQQAGTGKVIVDSCFFYSDMTGGGTTGTGVFPILSDFQSDTLIVTRNHIYNIDNSSNTTDVFGMCFRSFNPGSVLRVYNNMISLMAPNPSVDEIFGIELGTNTMNNPVDAEIYYNTVRVGGTATGGTAGNVNSAAFSMDESNIGSTINVRNNIFVNERTGGNEYHLAVNLTEFDGNITLNYNTYNDAGPDFAKYLTAVYPNFAAYQSAIAPQEANSNNTAVQFVSNTDLHLAGASIGDPTLAGITIPGITTDFDGDVRNIPYRGADEAILPGCFDPMLNHQINVFTSPSICVGDSAGMNVEYNPQDTTAIIDVQWQSSVDNISFSDIVGATSDTLYASPTSSTFYRYKLTCQTSGSEVYSASQLIEITPPPSIANINFFNTGMNFTFFAVTNQSPTIFNWDFGDGNTQTATNTISHTYTSPGNYTVQLIAINDCGESDTLTVSVLVTSITEINNNFMVELYPNPANDFVNIKAENIAAVEVYSIKGELVYKKEFGKINEVNLLLPELKSAVYFVKIITQEGSAIRKLAVKK